jgi:amino acid adenylation domain-containing protein/non-ribosomal peptide synthase protein (TIGR01720 family)
MTSADHPLPFPIGAPRGPQSGSAHGGQAAGSTGPEAPPAPTPGAASRSPSYRLPLSAAQERMWFLEQFDPGSAAYLVPICAWLSGPLRIDTLRTALAGVAARHDALRTRFPSDQGGKPIQEIDAGVALDFAIVDLGHLPAAQREGDALALVTAAAKRPFDLGRGPLWRTVVVRLDDLRHVLLVNVHHLIIDGRSFPPIFDEWSQLYRGHPAIQLPPAPAQYADFASWHRSWLDGGHGSAQLAYWTRQLADLEPFELAADRPRPRLPSSRGARVELPMPEHLARALRGHGAGLGISRFSLLLTALTALLHRYTGSADIPIAIPIANRDREEFASVVGMCINTVVIRTACAGDQGCDDLAQRVHALVGEARANAEIPFERVVQALRTGGEQPSAGLAQVMFDYQNRMVSPSLSIPGITARFCNIDNASATFDLVLSVHVQGESASCSVRYATDLFDQATIERLIGHYLILLEGMVARPQRALRDLPLLGAGEVRLLRDEWNATARPFPADACLHQLFAEQAARTPELIAVMDGERQIRYDELNRRANRMAHHLAALGAGPEQLVGIFLDRSLELIVAIIAALKAGSGYVPFDRKMTAERVGYMAKDAQLRLVVCEAEHAGLFPPGTAVVVPAEAEARIAALPAGDPVSGVGAGNVAYVIYTSGSTGAPKGVVIEHRSAVNAVLATIERYRFLAVDRTLFQSSVTFDSSVSKIFQSICNGGTLIVAPEDADFETVLALTARHGIPRLTTTPSELAVLNEMPERMPPGIQIIGAAGENLAPSDVDRILERVPILNIYGPTETTISTTSFRLTKGAFTAAGTVPIGKPIMNYQVYVLDRSLNLQPIGCIGELCIGGVGLARGYLGAEELTAAKFVANPFRPAERLYRSGDLARWLPDGNLEFRGRIDQQVKIRGYRIELGEIEHALGRHPEVQQAVVVARQAKPAGTYLTAYVVMSPGARTATEALREFLAHALPDYMVPARFMRLGEFPRMISGKVDRKALPEPDWSKRAIEHAATPPGNRREEILVGIWQQVLGIANVGVDDNFFALGGDSILSLQIIARASQAGVKVTLRQLFQERTIARLAAVAAQGGPSLEEQGSIAGRVPLTPIQRWFFARGFKRPGHWNMALWLDAGEAIDLAVLSRAVDAVTRHHDALRLRFTRDEDGWQQVHVDDGRSAEVLAVDLAEVAAGEQPAAAALAAARLQSGLDLAAGPLARFTLAALGGGRHALLAVVHHLLIDGVSWRILLEDLNTAYRAMAAGREPRLPAKTLSYKSWSQRLVAHGATAGVGAELAYWLAMIPASAPALPRDAEGDNRVGDAGDLVASLDRAETTALLKEVPAALHTQINEVLLTALVQAFSAWTGSSALLVDLEGHGREELFADADVSRTIGWFTSMFPLWIDLGDGGGPEAAVRRVKERMGALPHHGIGYGLLRHLDAASDGARRLAGKPAAEVVFNYLGQFAQEAPGGAVFSWSDRPVGPTRDPGERRAHLLDINCKVLAGQLTVTWTYARLIHREATVSALAAAFNDRLRALIALSRAQRPATLTPGDFPLAGLDQARLDKLMSLVSRKRPQ